MYAAPQLVPNAQSSNGLPTTATSPSIATALPNSSPAAASSATSLASCDPSVGAGSVGVAVGVSADAGCKSKM